MEMTDLGRKMDKDMPMPVGMKQDKMTYPTLRIENPPQELADKDVGHTCRLEIIVKITGKSQTDDYSDMTLEVQKVGYLSKAGKVSKEEYLKMSDEEKSIQDKKDMEEKTDDDSEDEKDDNA